MRFLNYLLRWWWHHWRCLCYICSWNRRYIRECHRFIKLAAVPEHHGFLLLFLRGFMHDDVMNSASPSSVKFPIVSVVLLNKIVLSFLSAISFVKGVKHSLFGRWRVELWVESKGPRLRRWVFNLIRWKLELGMLLSNGVEDKEGMLSLHLRCFSWRLIKNYFWLKLLSYLWLIPSESGSATSVTHSPSHSSLFPLLNFFLSFFPEDSLIGSVFLLSIKNAHVAVQRTCQIQVQVLSGCECSPGDSQHIFLKNILVDFENTQCRLFIALYQVVVRVHSKQLDGTWIF